MRKFLFVILTVFIPVFLYSQTWGDYTLYSVQNNTNAYLIDMNNNTYKSWSFASSKKTGYSTYLTKGDTLVRSYSSGGMDGGGGSTGGLQKVLWDGTVYWDITYANMHHDICTKTILKGLILSCRT